MTKSITRLDIEKSVKVSQRGALVRSDVLAKMFKRTHKQVLATIRKKIDDFDFLAEEVHKTQGGSYTRYYCPTVFVTYYSSIQKYRNTSKKSNLLYLLKAGSNYKIGITKIGEISKRVKTLQTGNPYLITVLHLIEMESAHKLENSLHKIFEPKRLQGEWFALDMDDVEYIKGIKNV